MAKVNFQTIDITGKKMPVLSLLFVGVFLIGLSSSIADISSIPKIEESYYASLSALQGTHDKLVSDSGDRYIEKLKQLEASFINNSQLDGVLSVRKEIDRFSLDRTIIPLNVVNEPYILRNLQFSYLRYLRKLNEKLHSQKDDLKKRYVVTLKQLQDELTKHNKIEDAVSVKDKITEILSLPSQDKEEKGDNKDNNFEEKSFSEKKTEWQTFKLQAKYEWTPILEVEKGKVIYIEADGAWSMGGNWGSCGPNGNPRTHGNEGGVTLYDDIPIPSGALVGFYGCDRKTKFIVGDEYEGIVPCSGTLMLKMRYGQYPPSGHLIIKVKIR